RWPNPRPGAPDAAIEHVDPDRHTVPVKAFGPPTTNPKDENRDLTRAAESLPDQDEKLDPITRAAFGEVYAEFVAARAGAPQTEDDVEEQDDDDVEDEDDDDVEDQDDDEVEEHDAA